MTEAYTVLSIDQLQRRKVEGGIEPYYQARIKTKGGVVLRVEISEKDYNPTKAAQILTKVATDTDAILHS